MSSYLDKWLSEGWTVGQYPLSKSFCSIKVHSCVCRPNLELIAVTGPAEDPESQKLSDLIAAAPEMLTALKELLIAIQRGPLASDYDKVIALDQAAKAIAKAEGQPHRTYYVSNEREGGK